MKVIQPIQILVPALALLGSVACSSNPYINTVVDDGVNGCTEYRFAYGTYCGPGYPPDRPGFGSRAEFLESLGPPKDDLDAACYAHDYCYEVSPRKIACDTALFGALRKLSEAFQERDRACWNLISDMGIAFMLKFWADSDSWWRTLNSRLYYAVFGLPLGGLAAVFKIPFRKGAGFPNTAGTCSAEGGRDEVIASFQRYYELSVFNLAKRKVEIRVPATWEEIDSNRRTFYSAEGITTCSESSEVPGER